MNSSPTQLPTISSNSVEPATEHNIGKGPMLSPLPTLVSTQGFLSRFTEPLIVLDEDWLIVYANPEAERLWRKSPDQLLGRPPWDMWPESERTEIERCHRQALDEHASVEIRQAVERESEKCLSLHAFSCELGIIVYYHDLTGQKTSTELQERLAAIVESS